MEETVQLLHGIEQVCRLQCFSLLLSRQRNKVHHHMEMLCRHFATSSAFKWTKREALSSAVVIRRMQILEMMFSFCGITLSCIQKYVPPTGQSVLRRHRQGCSENTHSKTSTRANTTELQRQQPIAPCEANRKFYMIYGTRRFITVFIKVPVLKQMDPLHKIQCYYPF
jgi:hypothetical protein